MEEAAPPFADRTSIAMLALAALALLGTAMEYLTPLRAAFSDVAWTSGALVALAGTLAARRHAHRANRIRWTLWSLAAAAWLIGQLAWNLFGLVGFPPSPNVADLGWWAFALLVAASMLSAPGAPRSLRVVAWLESLALALAGVALSVAMLWATALGSHLALPGKVSALAYPALYTAATMAMLQALLGGRLRGLRRLSMRLALAGILMQAVGFGLWSVQLLHGTYRPGHSPLDALWTVGLLAIGAGGLLAARDPEEAVALEEHSQQVLVLPSLALAVLLAAVGVTLITGAPAAATSSLRLGVICCGAALLVRSALLGRRMRAMLERERAALALLGEREADLARLNEQLAEDSRRDPLTGLGNRRALSDDLAMLEARARDTGEPIAIALCDADHFKRYNDQLGHLAGDQALRMIAASARGVLDGTGSVYRFGGEELLLVLRGATPLRAFDLAERLRLAVAHAAYPHPAGENGILTVSVGVACGTSELSTLLAQADAALYEAKRSGRNRVALAGDRTLQPPPAQGRVAEVEAPTSRHLRGMLALSRAAAGGAGAMSLLELLAETIRSELGFHIVAINLLEPGSAELQVKLVLGDPEAREALLGSSRSLGQWHELLQAGEQIHGAAFLRAGSYEWDVDTPLWTAPAVAAQAPDAWQPEDMLLLPLRGAGGELLGVASVDQPLLGRRPTPEEIGLLMAVADHAGLTLEQAQRRRTAAREEPEELRLAAVMLLAETLDMRDGATARHARTVGELARMSALALGLAPERVQRIYAAGVLHDLGKLGVPDAILRKPGPLDEGEWHQIRRHPEIGGRILELAGMHDIAAWVRSHHERFDGDGYPSGLRGSEIPLEARILAVADAYEAMIAERPYQPRLDPHDAREELLRATGTQFDPEVVNAFLRAACNPQPALAHAA
jgi:diguanylate cyclase (GGDEF)-like protein